jgi:hypothetical protein
MPTFAMLPLLKKSCHRLPPWRLKSTKSAANCESSAPKGSEKSAVPQDAFVVGRAQLTPTLQASCTLMFFSFASFIAKTKYRDRFRSSGGFAAARAVATPATIAPTTSIPTPRRFLIASMDLPLFLR